MPDARLAEIRDRFVERTGELWDLHEEEFMKVLEDSESRAVNLSFSATLDFSESTAKLETKIRFSQVITDEKQDDFDDPSQPRLPLDGLETKAAVNGPPPRKRKKTKVADEVNGE